MHAHRASRARRRVRVLEERHLSFDLLSARACLQEQRVTLALLQRTALAQRWQGRVLARERGQQAVVLRRRVK